MENDSRQAQTQKKWSQSVEWRHEGNDDVIKYICVCVCTCGMNGCGWGNFMSSLN